jgi:hypothetical protein
MTIMAIAFRGLIGDAMFAVLRSLGDLPFSPPGLWHLIDQARAYSNTDKF